MDKYLDFNCRILLLLEKMEKDEQKDGGMAHLKH